MTVPATPAAPAAAQPKTEAPTQPNTPDVASLQKQLDEYRQKAEAADKKLRVNAIEMKKFADDKKGIGAKLSEHGKMAKALEAAGVTVEDLMYLKANPDPFLKKALGDKYYDKLVEMRINGGALTADAVAAELERVKNDIRNEFTQKEENAKVEAERIANERADQARQQLAEEAGAFLEKNWSEYPIFEGNPKAEVARAIASHIEREYHRTGKVLTNKEAAEAIEGAQLAQAERLASIEKYRSKLTEKLKPASIAPTGVPLSRRTEGERRTLSNDLTASTPGQKRTPRTDEERRAAIMALQFKQG